MYVFNFLFSAYTGNLMMDFFLEDNPHDGFNEGKEIARRQVHPNNIV